MVKRRRDRTDKRVIWIEATPQGVIALQDAIADTLDGIRAMLSIAELRTLQAALQPLERLAGVVADNVSSGLVAKST